jgi:integrase
VKRASFNDPFLRGLERATPREERYEVFDDGTKNQKYPGLAIRVTHRGTKTFIMLYRRNGKLKRFTIGKFPIVSLRAARTKALEILRDPDADPAVTKRKRRAAPTFAELADEFRTRYVRTDAIRPSTAENYEIRLKYLVEHFGEMKVTDIEPDDVEDYRDDRAATPTGANRNVEVLSRCFSWAREDRELRALVPSNPCAGLKALPEKPRSRVLRRAELEAVMNAANELNARWRDALWWLALHGCRPSDIYLRIGKRGVSWADIDFDEREWSIPVAKTDPRVVPLTDTAIKLLDRVKSYNDSGPVFLARWDALAAAIRTEVGFAFEPRNLRTTVATEMQRLGVLPDIIDRVQGRRPWGPAVRARYQQHAYLDEQRDALAKWQAKLFSLDIFCPPRL